MNCQCAFSLMLVLEIPDPHPSVLPKNNYILHVVSVGALLIILKSKEKAYVTVLPRLILLYER